MTTPVPGGSTPGIDELYAMDVPEIEPRIGQVRVVAPVVTLA